MIVFVRLSLLGLPTIYVSPNGADANPGTKALPVLTLERARQLSTCGYAAAVSVAAGDYNLTKPLVLDASDSGVTWSCSDGVARVSGGVAIRGPWKPTAYGERIVQIDASWIKFYQDRHLWVNGQRARRTRMPEAAATSLFAGAKMTESGFALAGSTAPSWPNEGKGIEFVWPQSTSPWTEPRCAVRYANASYVEMMQPCWHNLLHKPCSQGAKGPPDLARRLPLLLPGLRSRHSPRGYVENVGASSSMLPGDWALQSNGTLVYALREGESAETLKAVMPVLDALLIVSGAKDVQFEGFAFEDSTFLGASGPNGYVEQQSGCGVVGQPPILNCANDTYWSYKLAEGAVRLTDCSRIGFVNCSFSRLGGVGLDLTRTTDSVIDRCNFTDISGNGIQIGQYQDPLASHKDARNVIKDSVIERAAMEFSGGVGIAAGYTQGLVIEHCDISNLTYAGISVGWGWSRHECAKCTNAANNTIRNNRIHNYKRTLNDGGGIYMLGPQNGSLIEGNYVYDQHTKTSGALYPDEGSAYSTWRGNVVSNIRGSEWLHLWTNTIHDVLVEGNYADTSTFLNHGTRCQMVNNTVYPAGEPPVAARAIMERAGVRK